MQQKNGIKQTVKNLIYSTALSLIFIGLIACGSSVKSSTPAKRTPEEIQVNSLASQLETDIGSLQKDAPEDLQQPLSDLEEAANRFNNNSQRFGPGSLEARNAYDQIRYQLTVINKKLTKDAYPQLFDRWTKLQAEINEIGKHLGYRGGKYPE